MMAQSLFAMWFRLIGPSPFACDIISNASNFMELRSSIACHVVSWSHASTLQSGTLLSDWPNIIQPFFFNFFLSWSWVPGYRLTLCFDFSVLQTFSLFTLPHIDLHGGSARWAGLGYDSLSDVAFELLNFCFEGFSYFVFKGPLCSNKTLLLFILFMSYYCG